MYLGKIVTSFLALLVVGVQKMLMFAAVEIIEMESNWLCSMM